MSIILTEKRQLQAFNMSHSKKQKQKNVCISCFPNLIILDARKTNWHSLFIKPNVDFTVTVYCCFINV